MRLRADVFPAVLVVAPADSSTPATSLSTPPPGSDHRLVDKVRVIVTLEEVLVYQDTPTPAPTLIFRENLLDYTPPPRAARARQRSLYTPREATLTTESGKTLAFHRSSGCGCGSRLKSFNPFASSAAPPSFSSVKDR